MSFRVIFLGTPDIATPCLERLVSIPEIEVVGVITQPDRPAGRHMKLQASPVKQVALKHGLEVFSPESAKTSETLDWIRARKPDSSVVVAYGQILSKDFLELFPKKSVNVHASILPRWRGAAPIQRSIMEGDKVTGVSLQVIVPKLDAGPLIGAREISLGDMNALELYAKLQSSAPELLEKEYLEYLRGTRMPVDQDESKVTIAKKILKEEGLIDWKLAAEVIRHRIHGLWMWPGSWTVRNGKTLKVWKTRIPDAGSRMLDPGLNTGCGTVIGISEQSFSVACGYGVLEIFEVQPESRARMPVSEYLKGYPMKIGEKLGS